MSRSIKVLTPPQVNTTVLTSVCGVGRLRVNIGSFLTDWGGAHDKNDCPGAIKSKGFNT